VRKLSVIALLRSGSVCLQIAAAAAAAAQPASHRPLTVRVDASYGAPRLLVNGKPRRARIFWGQPSSQPIHLAEQERTIQFEFTPVQGEPSSATMHFRFGHTPGDVYLKDIRVTDLDTGREIVPASRFAGGMADGRICARLADLAASAPEHRRNRDGRAGR
jgi:hypothetical protein